MIDELNYAITERDIDKIFNYYDAKDIPPKVFSDIRAFAKLLGKAIINNGITMHDKHMSIQRLRECVFYAIASIVVPKLGD